MRVLWDTGHQFVPQLSLYLNPGRDREMYRDIELEG